MTYGHGDMGLKSIKNMSLPASLSKKIKAYHSRAAPNSGVTGEDAPLKNISRRCYAMSRQFFEGVVHTPLAGRGVSEKVLALFRIA